MKFCEKCEFYNIDYMEFSDPIKIRVCNCCFAFVSLDNRINFFYMKARKDNNDRIVINSEGCFVDYFWLNSEDCKKLGIEDIEEFKKKIERLEYTSDCKYYFERKVEE